MGTKKTTTTQNQTGTTTPVAPSGAQGSIDTLFNQIQNYVGSNPQQFVTPPSALQQQAYQGAANLGATNNNAASMVGQTLNDYGAKSQATVNNLNPRSAETIAAFTPTTPAVTNVADVGNRGVATAGVAQMPTAATIGDPRMWDVAQASGGVGGEVERAQAASLLDNLSKYQNPYTQQVVDTSLASFDNNAAQQRAQYAAQGARNGAFGGSRFGIGETNLQAQQGLNRGGMEAGLRSDSFNTAANLSNLDAGRRQETGIFNAGQKNDRDNLNGQLSTQASIANAGYSNDAAKSYAQMMQESGMFNAGQTNQFGLAGFNAQNNVNLANAGAYNNAFEQMFGEANSNNRQNANATNSMNELGFSTNAETNRFNAGQANSANQFNTDQFNNMQQFNRTEANDANQFGANLGMEGANLLNSIYGTNSNAQNQNVQTQADIGNQQWQQQQMQQLAPLLQTQQGIQLLTQLMGPLMGQSATSNSTGTTKESGGMLGQLLGAAGQLGSAAIMASDRRLKRDIVKVGRIENGLPWYRFNYIWDDDSQAPREGLMSDDVRQINPDAVVIDTETGYDLVNYTLAMEN
jgi:hypothetical protein